MSNDIIFIIKEKGNLESDVITAFLDRDDAIAACQKHNSQGAKSRYWRDWVITEKVIGTIPNDEGYKGVTDGPYSTHEEYAKHVKDDAEFKVKVAKVAADRERKAALRAICNDVDSLFKNDYDMLAENNSIALTDARMNASIGGQFNRDKFKSDKKIVNDYFDMRKENLDLAWRKEYDWRVEHYDANRYNAQRPDDDIVIVIFDDFSVDDKVRQALERKAEHNTPRSRENGCFS